LLLDDEHGEPVARRGLDGLDQPLHDDRGQAQRQLVGDEDPGRPRQGAGVREDLLLAAGQGADVAAAQPVQLREARNAMSMSPRPRRRLSVTDSSLMIDFPSEM
jgi:hypothetical protein